MIERQLQIVEDWHRESQEDQVTQDREACISIPEDRRVQADAIDGLVPCARDGCTLEDRGEGRRDSIQNHEGQENPACLAERLLNKYAKVQKQN